jgi:hypothetical protein
VGCLLAIRERRGQETQSMMLAEVVHRNPKQLAEDCQRGKRATIGVRFYGAEGTQYALSTILDSEMSTEAAGVTSPDATAVCAVRKVRRRDGDGTVSQAKTGAGLGAQPQAGIVSSPQEAAAAAAIARLDIATAEDKTLPPPPPRRSGDGPSDRSSAATPEAAAPGREAHRSDTQRQSVASEAEPPLVVDAVQIAHDFGVCKPVLQALQEDRLLEPPFSQTLFTATGKAPQSEYIAPPTWQTDEQMAAWLYKRLDTMDPAQQEAFDHALSRKVALIQGPPGVCLSKSAMSCAGDDTECTQSSDKCTISSVYTPSMQACGPR